MGYNVCEWVGVRERREADVGLHIEKVQAGGDEERRGGKKVQTEIEGGREGLGGK